MRASYCGNCGLEPGDQLRCRSCRTLSPNAALLANNVALLLVFLTLDFVWMWKVIPRLASQYAHAGLRLPWLTRMHVFAFNLTAGWGVVLAILVLAPLLIWRRSVVVRWLKDPRVSGSVAWVVVAVTLIALVSQWLAAGP